MRNICEKFFVTLQLGEYFKIRNGGLERFTFIFYLMKKREKILRQAQNDKKILSLVSF